MRLIDSPKEFRKHTHSVTHAHVRRDGGDAFIKDPSGGRAPSRTREVLGETLAEQFVGSITTAQFSDALDDVSDTEEQRGPNLTTGATLENGRGVDGSNAVDAARSSLPQAVSDLLDMIGEEVTGQDL